MNTYATWCGNCTCFCLHAAVIKRGGRYSKQYHLLGPYKKEKSYFCKFIYKEKNVKKVKYTRLLYTEFSILMNNSLVKGFRHLRLS